MFGDQPPLGWITGWGLSNLVSHLPFTSFSSFGSKFISFAFNRTCMWIYVMPDCEDKLLQEYFSRFKHYVKIYTLDSYHCHIISNILPPNNHPFVSINYSWTLWETSSWTKQKFSAKFGKDFNSWIYTTLSIKPANKLNRKAVKRKEIPPPPNLN